MMLYLHAGWVASMPTGMDIDFIRAAVKGI